MNRNDIENILLKIGVPAGIKGFKYITDAVLCLEDDAVCSMTKELYPAVARINKTTTSRVERAIRHALDVARSPKGNYNAVEHYIGFMNCTNSNSLKMLHTRIIQECKEKEKEKNMECATFSKEEVRNIVRTIVREELKAIIGEL